MRCNQCRHEPPDGSRFCNMCGALLGTREGGPVAPRLEQRRIFIDLADLAITGYLGDAGLRAAVCASVCERFTPFADDGWEWAVHPGEPTFDGWVYEHAGQGLRIVGVHLLCNRVRWSDPNWVDPTHHVSEYRVLQLTGTPWTAAEGTKLWKEIPR